MASETWTVIELQEVDALRSTRSKKPAPKSRFVEKDLGRFEIERPSLQKDPKQYHKSMNKAQRERTAILSLTSDVGDGVGTVAAILDTMQPPELWGQEIIQSLLTIFQFLNPCLVLHDDDGTDNISAYINPSDDGLGSCSVLHRCIHALASGDLIDEEANTTTLWRNRRAASFTATDIIRNLKRGTVGRLKEFVSRQLIANGATQGIWKIFTKLGITSGIEKERKKSIEAVHTELLRGLPELDPHDLWLLLYDNIGFKVMKGYLQFTAMQWIRIPKELLMEWGIYPKENEDMDFYPFQNDHQFVGLNYRDLRKRLEWSDIRRETSFEDVLGIKDNDVKRLADSTFGIIDQMLSVFDELPTLEEAIEILKTGKERKWNRCYSAQEERFEGESVGGVVSSNVAVNATSVREDEVEARETFATNYQANDSHIDRPIKSDLNAKPTCRALLDYAVLMRQRVLDREAQGRWTDIPKILEDAPLPLCGDGNPTFMMSNIMKEEQGTYNRKVVARTGGFHMLLETHRKRGSAFGKSHLEDFFSCWRPTEGQLRWVMDPGDPNQINAELIMYVLGMYSAAISSLLRIGAVEGEGEDIQVSAKDVNDLILERAKKWPIVMMVLIELRFAQIAFMLLDSEEAGDVDLYLTAQKFLSSLFASTHCTKYVNMLAELFVDWFCSSPAEKIVFAKGVFTRNTKNGEKIFTVSAIRIFRHYQ